MTVDFAKIEQLVDLVSRSRIAELELTQDGARVRIVKSPASRAAIPVSPAPELRPEEIRAATQEIVHSPDVSSTDEIIVPAPMHGVFYLAAAPDEPPLVGIGANIELGQKICIIEAMKTFMDVAAETPGAVVAILAENGDEIEAGQALFRIRPAGPS